MTWTSIWISLDLMVWMRKKMAMAADQLDFSFIPAMQLSSAIVPVQSPFIVLQTHLLSS
jgi:hypothetical protein